MELRSYRSFKGYTLLEVLVVLGLLTIISSISVISYQSTTHSTNLKQMYNTAKLFVTSMHSCISSAGGWKIDKSNIGSSTPLITPCDELAKLNFECPRGSSLDATQSDYKECKELKHNPATTTATATKGENFVCLDFRKKINRKNHQIVVIVRTKNPSDYKIYCNEVSSYEDVTNANCAIDSTTKHITNTTIRAWNSGNDGGVCEWPNASK